MELLQAYAFLSALWGNGLIDLRDRYFYPLSSCRRRKPLRRFPVSFPERSSFPSLPLYSGKTKPVVDTKQEMA